MKTLAKYHVCNRCVIGEKTFKNILNGPGKLPGLSRKGALDWSIKHCDYNQDKPETAR